MKVLFVVSVALAAMAAIAESRVSLDELLLAEWNEFKEIHGKTYESGAQEDRRFQIYLASRKSVAEHNYGFALGIHSYRMAVNKFSDMKADEIVFSSTGYRPRKGTSRSMSRLTYDVKVNVSDLPTSVDWREKGVVTPIKDQGQCGSCWSFSTTGSIEGANAIKTGKLISLSEKQLVDCSTQNNGCQGGLMDYAYEYIINNGGIESEKTYPYTPKERQCKFNISNVVVTMKKYVDIDRDDETKLMHAVARMGPVSVAIIALDSLFHYKDGVYSDSKCNTASPWESGIHAVLIVGYGTDPKQGDYWIIKNSWSADWGDSGYFKLARNKNNMCGVASAASYPLLSGDF